MLTRVPSDAWLVAVHIRAGDRGMLAERKANRERPVTASKGTSSDVRSTGAHLDHVVDVTAMAATAHRNYARAFSKKIPIQPIYHLGCMIL